MAEHALGTITPPTTTTALRATNNQSDPTRKFSCQALQFQVLTTNTDYVYIVTKASPSLTTDVLAVIPPPSTTTPKTVPAWVIGNPAGANPFNAAGFYILPAIAGEGVRVTAVVT